MNKKKNSTVVIVLLLLIAAVILGVNWQNWFGQEPAPDLAAVELAEDWTGERKGEQKPASTIDIPGYEKIQLKAGSLEQAVNFYNPESNPCYFKLSLWKDAETKLWESKLLEPGKAIYDLTLDQPLAAGTYDQAMVKYECFSLENQTPLNGSEIKIILEAF